MSKAAWLEKVHKELKDKQLADLNWPIGPSVIVEPFAHADDFLEKPAPLADPFFEKNGWQLNEKIEAADSVFGNQTALAALAGGADSLTFMFEKEPSNAAFSQLLDGVFPEMISLHFAGKAVSESPSSFFGLLKIWAASKKTDPKNLSGSLHFDPATAQNEKWDARFLKELIEFAEADFPKMKILTLASSPSISDPTEQLADWLRRSNFYFETLEKRGLPPEKVAAAMQFSIEIGPDFLTEVGKLRAFKVLWLNLLRAWKIENLTWPTVEISFSKNAYVENENSNLIRATTMAAAAIIGGAARLTVRPSAENSTDFHRRLARNVQHILKEESYFERVSDPAAGSYFLEKLTAQLAEAVWKSFCHD